MPGLIYNALASIPVPQGYGIIESLPLKWTPGETFLSTAPEVIAILAVYFVTIFSGQYFMTDKKAFRFQHLFMLHNALLSAGSLLLLVLMVEELYPIIRDHGLFYGICHHNAWTSRLEMFYIINYYFKYWELVDTVFLVVKKKPLQFLHVFHHSATAVLCYTQLNGRTSVSWTVITLNLTVHVFMYYYYFMTAAGYKIWWKKYLTTLQIIQFVIDLFVVYFASYSYFVTEYIPGKLPTMGTCSGAESAALSGCGLLTSYLFLFIAFYRKTYNAEKAKKALAKKLQ